MPRLAPSVEQTARHLAQDCSASAGTREELIRALLLTQLALANWRDFEDPCLYLPDGRALCLEEVKYLVVDQALGND